MRQIATGAARAAPTGRRVAAVGAGPAGLACAHRLALKGHAVTLFDARRRAGGLNEFGIASYKTVDDFAAREVDWLLGVGGIAVELGQRLGAELTLDSLARDYEAVFLGIGLAGVNALGVAGDAAVNVRDAVDFIAELRQAEDLASLPVGRRVVVIGGGMTAVDAAVQSKLLGAEDVAMVYRRGRDTMSASGFEQDLATSKRVRILTNAGPCAWWRTVRCGRWSLRTPRTAPTASATPARRSGCRPIRYSRRSARSSKARRAAWRSRAARSG